MDKIIFRFCLTLFIGILLGWGISTYNYNKSIEKWKSLFEEVSTNFDREIKNYGQEVEKLRKVCGF